MQLDVSDEAQDLDPGERSGSSPGASHRFSSADSEVESRGGTSRPIRRAHHDAFQGFVHEANFGEINVETQGKTF